MPSPDSSSADLRPVRPDIHDIRSLTATGPIPRVPARRVDVGRLDGRAGRPAVQD